PNDGRDSFGYGYCDFITVPYTDIDPAGVAGTLIRLPAGSPLDSGALGANGTQALNITDGLSNTIGIIEDVGRGEQVPSAQYGDPVGFEVVSGYRPNWRWAAPTSG